MSNFTYIPFSSYDYKNENVLSSYALEGTPLTFIANLDNFPSKKVLWNFGDGTVSTELSAKKSYTYPGQYIVKLVVYDCFSNAQVSSEIKTYNIYDFYDHTFNISFSGNDLNNAIYWENGKINGPIYINAYYPPYQPLTDIYYKVTNSDSEYFFTINNEKYVHLKKTYSFFDKIFNNYIQTFQFNEISKITPLSSEVYAKISNNQIVFASKNDPDSFFVGLSGHKEVYFKDDSVSGPINIELFFDKNKNVISDYGQGVNNLGITLSATIVNNNDIDSFSITSNGLDGEFYIIDSFNFDEMKFSNVLIPFVVKIKDSDNYTVKNFGLSSLSSFNVKVLSSGDIPIDQSYYTLDQIQSYNGSIRGTMKFNFTNTATDLYLSAIALTINDQGSSYQIQGFSNTFNVYPQNYIYLEKKNEDFDATETFKDLRFQEILLDKNVLFDDFMGSIFGTLSSNYDTLGKKIYEKISNFVENTQDVDRNEIVALISQMDMLDLNKNIYELNKFSFPDRIKRLVDLASISKNKLFGFENKFNQNFDIKGRTSKDEYGINIGNQIDIDSYTITAGVPIVALEKFSNDYVLLNTLQPMESLSSTQYKLSAYTSDWGWPLVLPSNFVYTDFPKFYTFFEYVSAYDNTIVDYTVKDAPNLEFTYTEEKYLTDSNNNYILDDDGNRILVSLFFNNIFSKDLIFKNMMLDTLSQSLSLIHS